VPANATRCGRGAAPKMARRLAMYALALHPFSLAKSSSGGGVEYVYDPTAFKLPSDSPPMLHGHGLAKDLDGTIYFTYVVNATTPGPNDRCLVQFAPQNGVYSGEGKMIGDPLLSQGTPHGLRIDSDSDLYHANNNQVVRKTSLDGTIKWTTFDPPNNDSAYWPYMPTDAVVAPPGSNNLFVSDGYGSSFVHLMDAESGEWSNLTFGGPSGGGSDHGQLNTYGLPPTADRSPPSASYTTPLHRSTITD